MVSTGPFFVQSPPMQNDPMGTVDAMLRSSRVADATATVARLAAAGHGGALFQQALWQLQGHPLLHLATRNHRGAVPDESVILRLEPPADLNVAQQLWVAECCGSVDHRLQVDLSLTHTMS